VELMTVAEIIEPTFDKDGYPTDETLRIVREWKHENRFNNLMAFVRDAWKYDGFNTTLREDGKAFVYTVHTFGWSGNEELIGALSGNQLFWALCWQESRRGGHYRFEVSL
jgi:hypothetical protein